MRSVIISIKDINEDKLLGREALPVLIGKEKTINAMIVTLLLASILIISLTFSLNLTRLNYFLPLFFIYSILNLFVFYKRPKIYPISSEITVDGVFIAVGVFALFI